MIFTLILVLKLAWLRHLLAQAWSWNAALIDLASVLVLTGLVELALPGKLKRSGYWLLDLALSLMFFAAAVYYQHFDTIVTYTALTGVKQLGQIQSSVKSTIEPLDFIFWADVPFGVLLAVRRARGAKPWLKPLPWRKLTVTALSLVGLTASVWLIRYDDGIANELVRAESIGFLNYQVSAALNGTKDETNFTSLQEAIAVVPRVENKYDYGKKSPAAEKAPLFATQRGKNVIVVQMEAFQNFPVGLKLGDQEITPNLNKLAKESYYFSRIFQQIGQGNTSDAEFMSNTSIYPTGTIAMSTGFGDRNLPSLPKLLQKQGYEADTFHVNDVGFWDRAKLYPAIGFDHYFDKPYYNNDNFNSFGASDEELYRVAGGKLKELHDQGKPFYAQLITVSSHHPFVIPKDRRKMELPASLEGKQLGDYLLAINYTDYALGKFIDQLKADGLWDNTIFVAYGDHFGLQPEDNDPKFVSGALGITYHPYVSKFNVPLFIHVPGQKQGQTISQVGGQLDIMPTVANLLGISFKKENVVHFGQNLFNITRNAFGMRYYLPTGSFFNNDILFIPGKGFDDGTAVSLSTLQPVSDFSQYRGDYDYVLRLMRMSDDYVKLLPKR
ncbi:LTA synthase family protein [Gordoniibacillus kamchatkensis]|uniref:LTA synthase family protein n=1 Tax=Gordoniibacillus kamchatkensis TaxID=1590651 RepID=UPI001E432459|nr:LTA synthase family protein [Paenibacillus sp. VKM B-2647]